MEPASEITRYRPDGLSRFGPPSFGLVTLALWSYVVVRDDEVALFPAIIALSAAIAAIAGWFSLSRGVTFTPAALVVRTHRGTTVHPWSAITTLERRWNIIWLMTAEGWFVLPINGSRHPAGPSTETRNLGDAIWATWMARRGDDWTPEVLAPWVPTLDLAGRAVLRPGIEARLLLVTCTSGLLGVALVPNQQPGGLAGSLTALVVIVGLSVLVTGIYHWWARVTVTGDELVVRSATTGVVRVPLAHAFHLRETSDSYPIANAGRRFTRLAFDVYAPDEYDPWPQYRRTVRLPAPATTQRAYGNDPAYHRKWAWLHDQLAAAHTQAPASTPVDAEPLER